MEQTEKKSVPHLKAWGNWLTMYQDLNDAQFGQLMRAAIGYVCAGEEPSIDGWDKEVRLSFHWLRPTLDSNRENYLDLSSKNSENGKKGANARWGKDGERHLTDGERQEEEREEDQRKKREVQREITEEQGVIGGENFSHDDTSNGATATEKLQTAWRKYRKMRESMEPPKPITSEDMNALQANLKRYAGEDKRKQASLLEKAADKGWMNVFPDEEEKSKAHQVNGTVKKLARGMAL